MNKKIKSLVDFLESKGIDKEEVQPYLSQIEKDLKNKKYGLVWEEQEENIYKDLKSNFPILREVKEKEIKINENDLTHLLIEGDNLEALTALQYTHKEKIDVIYIDPPYNTGSKDFKYNDKFVDKEDSWRHSSWLSFINKRLKLARKLLTEAGVIFISIDDNEMCQLKLLCDEIFGEENFIANIAVELTKTQGMKTASAQNGNIVKNKEYILVYQKSQNDSIRTPLYDGDDSWDKHYRFYVNDNLNIINLTDYLNEDKNIEEIVGKKIKWTQPLIEKYVFSDKKFKKYLYEKLSSNIYLQTMISVNIPKEIECQVKSGTAYIWNNGKREYILIRMKDGNIKQLIPLSKSLKISDDIYPEFNRCTIRGDLWKGFYSDMINISKEADIEFKNGKKPVRLLKQLLKWSVYENKNAVILDFFAGSGTTGHAVLELNKEDDGNRQFILCTNNEVNERTEKDIFTEKGLLKDVSISEFKETKQYNLEKESKEYQSKGICQSVTYPRLEKVINGYTTSKGKDVEGLGGNLKYYRVELEKNLEDPDENNENLINKCVDLIAIKEDCFNKLEFNDTYEILENQEKVVLIYKNTLALDYEVKEISKVLDKYNNKFKIIYSTNTSKCIDGIEIKEYPSEIIKQLKIRRDFM